MSKTILFYPDLPRKTNRVWHCCKENGYEFHNNPKKPFHMVFFWSYTKTVWHPDKFYNKLLKDNQLIINNGCRNIGKDYVELVFETIFRYPSCVNPAIHKGKIIEKTIKQDAKNEINIVDCPRKPKKGFIYQKIIKTGLVDIRVFVSNRKAEFVITKHKEGFIFQRNLIDCKFYETKDIFSQEEIIKINKFCEAFTLDFGELDILRDTDGIIYIVDVNNIAGQGAFRPFPQPEKRKHQKRYYNTFKDTINKSIEDAY